MDVEVDDGSGYTSVQTYTGEQQFSRTDSWKEAIISLSAYANDTVKIRFKATKPNFNTLADVAIDDLDVHETPSCPKPSNFTINATSDGFVLNWTSGGAANWQLEYGPPGFAPGNGTILNVATNPYTLTGLSSSTAYDLYLRDSCSTNDLSAWIGPFADTTLCSVFSAPFSENFDGSNWVEGVLFNDPGSLDACWDRNSLNSYFWTVGQNGTDDFNTGAAQDHTTGSGKFVYSNFNGGSADSTILFTPLVDLSTLTSPELRVWTHMFGNDIGKLVIEIWDGASLDLRIDDNRAAANQ
ncbi:MAG: hypothetical protein U5L96_04745 [Owenweeksia sp.]|nr:hypothetical protein [Owenweeksia sp.]